MKRDFSLLAAKPFDLLVCGGGIYGAWTAYDAALRGLSVAIVEQNDWAVATSSASSKLIHGGLRYLETLDFKLVRKALKERQRLLSIAPHRVWPLRFGVPMYAHSRIGALKLAAGLTLYDFLAGGTAPDMTHRRFRSREFAGRFTALDPAHLNGGFTYADAQTDDARLVLELIDGAMAAGAVCVNYCRLTELIETGGQAAGAVLRDQISGDYTQVSARQIVYATGQWTAATKEGSGWCRLTKGVHLVLPAVLHDEALLLTAPADGRVFFMIPWYGRTLVGTTDTDYRGDINHVAAEPAEVDYLLQAADHYLKSAWTKNDIIASYAGLRVMKQSEKGAPSDLSRDWELKTAANGAHYSIGGKITSARVDAAQIVNAVCARLSVNATCRTGEKLFPWMPQENYAAWLTETAAHAQRVGVDSECAKWLMRRHGGRANAILALIENDPRLGERIVPALPFMYADLLWSAENEMVVHLADLLRRRMPLMLLDKLGEDDMRRCAATVAPVLGWDEARISEEVAACRQVRRQPE
jgi:glycerol-3-phosphate dehydrogenase